MTNVAEERVYDVPLTPLHAFHLPLTPLLKIDSRKAIVLDDTGTRKVAIIDISGELVGCTMYNVVVGQQVLLLENKITRLVSSMGVYSDRMDSTVLSVNTKNGHMGVNNGCPNVALDIQGDTKISGTFALGANDDLKIKSLSNQGVSISSQKLMLDSYVEVVGGLKVPLVDTRYASFGLDGMVVYNPYKRQYEGFIDNRWTQLGQRYPETFMINVTDETTVVNADTVNPIYTFLPPGNIRVLRTRIHVRDFGDGPTSIMIRTRSFETMINVATVINTYGIVNSFQKWEVNEQDLVSIYIISTAGKTKGVKITFWYVHIFDEDEYKYIL
jgi:hypothetical protein